MVTTGRREISGAKSSAYFEEFVRGMEQISTASRKILEIGRSMTDVTDLLRAEEKLDNLPVKAFGDGGSHIVIRGHDHVGKKTKVIIKK